MLCLFEFCNCSGFAIPYRRLRSKRLLHTGFQTSFFRRISEASGDPIVLFTGYEQGTSKYRDRYSKHCSKILSPQQSQLPNDSDSIGATRPRQLVEKPIGSTCIIPAAMIS